MPRTVNFNQVRLARQRLVGEPNHWARTTLLTIGYAVVVYYSYKLKVTPIFAGTGLTYRAPSPLSYGIAITLTVLLAIALPRQIRHTSDFILWLFFALASAPAILLPQYMQALSPHDANRLSFAVFATTLVVLILAKARPLPPLRITSVPAGFLWAFMGTFAVAVYLVLFITTGLSLRFISFTDAYDTRSEFEAYSVSLPVVAYMLPVVYNVINPTFMARGVYSGRWRFFIAGAVGQYIVYSATGQKSVLFSTVAVIGLARLFRKDMRLKGSKLLSALAVLAVVGLMYDYITGGINMTSLFVRRFLIIPGALVAGYVQTFDKFPRYGFSRFLPGDAPSDTVPALQVGFYFTHGPHTSANASLFGDGYAQAGYAGVFVEAVLLVLMLWAADAATRGLPKPVTALMFFMPTIAVTSGAITTVLLTHGFWAAIVLAAMLPRTGWGREQPKTVGSAVAPVRSLHPVPD